MFFLLSYCDFPSENQVLFQDPASPMSEGIVNLHDDLMFLLIVIAMFTCWMLCRIIYEYTVIEKTNYFSRLWLRTRGEISLSPQTDVVSHPTLEIVWTIIPALILALLAVPSFALIYALDEIVDPIFTLKVIGNQWYWHYDYSECSSEDLSQLSYDSYMVASDDLSPTDLRLLEVDNRVVLPILTHLRLLITSSDVLHCWTVPSLGVKVDGVPGRLNQLAVYIKREGKFYGQCSEICGINHAFMPIMVEGVNLLDFERWVRSEEEGMVISNFAVQPGSDGDLTKTYSKLLRSYFA